MRDELRPPDEPLSEDELVELEELNERATAAPWWFDEDERYYRLHGTGGWIPAQGSGEFRIPSQPLNHQIIKAAKQSEIFMPYWPNEPDGVLIPKMRNALPRLLKELRELRELTQRCICGDGSTGDHRGAQPDCPVHGAVRLLRSMDAELKDLRSRYYTFRTAVRQALQSDGGKDG